MATRVVKHLGARSCPADDAKVLLLVPTFPGEKVLSVQMDAYFASGDDSSIDQTGEVNWYGISMPWGLVFASNLLNAGGSPIAMNSVANFDTLYYQWLRAVDAGGDEYYGGDVDADPETTSAEEGHANEELLDSGPIGVHTWFSRESLMQPFAAEGNNVIRFGDSFHAVIDNIPVSNMGSLLMFGCVRFEHAVETNFNVELDDATSREMLGMLIAGDYTKVKARVEGDTAGTGDFLRTVLYGGDNYIESDTLKGPAGKGFAKAKFVIGTSEQLSRIQ